MDVSFTYSQDATLIPSALFSKYRVNFLISLTLLKLLGMNNFMRSLMRHGACDIISADLVWISFWNSYTIVGTLLGSQSMALQRARFIQNIFTKSPTSVLRACLACWVNDCASQMRRMTLASNALRAMAGLQVSGVSILVGATLGCFTT